MEKGEAAVGSEEQATVDPEEEKKKAEEGKKAPGASSCSGSK